MFLPGLDFPYGTVGTILPRNQGEHNCRVNHTGFLSPPQVFAFECPEGCRQHQNQRPGLAAHRQARLRRQALGETHRLAQAVQYGELTMAQGGHDHVETVGTQIDSGYDAVLGVIVVLVGIGDDAGLPCFPPAAAVAASERQTENDEPQPQVVWALGLRMMNCAPSRSSL